MKTTKTDYLKQCWEYVTTTLKYLKDISGNPLGMTRRNEDFIGVSDLLRKMSSLESLFLVENEFYTSKKYSDQDFTGKFIGYVLNGGEFNIRFEILSANAKIDYDDAQDIVEFGLSNVGNRTFIGIDITKEDLPLHMSKPFQGKLLEKMLKKEGKI